MKKILTILAASAMFFAFGEDISNGINFEAYTNVGEGSFPGSEEAYDPGTQNQYWYSANYTGNVISNHVNGTPDLPQGVTVPDMFTNDVSNTKFLYLETESPLFRSVKTNTHNPSNFTGVSIAENPIYLDTLVKFTAADSAFTSFEDAADKIAIEYVEHEEESHEDQTTGETVIDSYGFTNFVIRAGFIASSTALVATNYVVALPDGWLENNKKDAWHRLTVRTLTNIDGNNRVGFKIYLDETPMVYITDDAPKYADFAKGAGIDDDTHTIFPSAVETDKNNYNEISAVAFSGNGSIDDVVFTTTKPKFIAESEAVVVPFVADAGVTAISVSVAGVTDPISVVNGSATLPAQTTAFTVNVTVDEANGYTFGSMTVGDAVYNTNPASVTGYAGGDITITTIRNNFNLFDANGEPIEGTFQTLSAALAADGVAKIVLAHSYDVAESEGDGFGSYDIDNNITLDLNGNTITGGGDDELFTVGNGVTMIVIDSSAANTGKINYTGTYAVFYSEGDVVIGALTGDYGPSIDGYLAAAEDDGDGVWLVKGKIEAATNSDGDDFLWDGYFGNPTGTITAAAELDSDEEYWVVTPASDGTYNVTVTPNANATYAAAYTVGGEEIVPANNVLTVTVGQAITITARPVSGYVYAETPTGWTAGQDGAITIEVDEAGTVEIPAPTAVVIGTYNVTVIPTNNTTYAVTGAASNVGDVYTVATGHSITITVTPDTNYEYASAPAGWTAGANGVITKEISEAGPVEIPGPTAKSNWPSGWNSGNEPASMVTAFNTWIGVEGNDPTAANAEAAFLVGVNLADYTSDFAAASITIANGKVVITGNYNLSNVNGALAVKMGDAPNALGEPTAVTAVEGAISLTPALGETKKFYKLVIGYPAN